MLPFEAYPIPLLLRGYAVLTTDYAGLGNNFTEHKYISFAIHTHDLYYSVQIVYKAFPTGFIDERISIGHSKEVAQSLSIPWSRAYLVGT